jgi:hypothetical protein
MNGTCNTHGDVKVSQNCSGNLQRRGQIGDKCGGGFNIEADFRSRG